MKYLFVLLLSICLYSCHPTYVILGYEQPDWDSIGYSYLLQHATFPKYYKYLYVKDTCNCMHAGDTVFFTRENDSLVVNKFKK
ncbi:MAG: hypothetical protein WC979_01160 [Candidatus Pacearchaeota archaeon]|nr:hypothetical protein [Clostridia bacterium]